jgi:Carboxypeptidase regulatory-like domain
VLQFPKPILFALPLMLLINLGLVPASPGGEVKGTVSDINGARVGGASLHFLGPGREVVTISTEEGTYSVHLEPGRYRVEVTHTGFSQARRGDFDIGRDSAFRFDFELVSGGIIDTIKVPVAPKQDGGSSGNGSKNGADVIEGTYRFEELQAPQGESIRPLVAFGHSDIFSTLSRYVGPVVEGKYLPAIVTYDRYTFKANSIKYSRDDFSLVGEGDASWDDGATVRTGSRIDILLSGHDPILKFLQ